MRAADRDSHAGIFEFQSPESVQYRDLKNRPAGSGFVNVPQSWPSDPREGDAFLDWGAHACDAIRWFTGAEPVRVYADLLPASDGTAPFSIHTFNQITGGNTIFPRQAAIANDHFPVHSIICAPELSAGFVVPCSQVEIPIELSESTSGDIARITESVGSHGRPKASILAAPDLRRAYTGGAFDSRI